MPKGALSLKNKFCLSQCVKGIEKVETSRFNYSDALKTTTALEQLVLLFLLFLANCEC